MEIKKVAMNKNDLDRMEKMAGHEQVMFCNDPSVGLKAIIAIHDTTLGPALGGTRMYPYATVDKALEDVLRLSEGMTYKCAAADIDFGGGKAVIIGNPKTDKTAALLRSFGQYVDSFNGRFYTGTDMGTTMNDFIQVSKETNFVTGIPEVYGGGGDSSIRTSEGVIYSLQVTSQYLSRSRELGGKTYAIQGLGKVGFKVASYLLEIGANVFVTDVHEDVLEKIKRKANNLKGSVTVVNSDDIYGVDADIFIPCAMGGVINDHTIEQLRVKSIVGSANNQLRSTKHAKDLHNKGILYAPDYIVNSAGLIQVADELYEPNKDRVLLKTKEIYQSLLEIYQQAAVEGMNTLEAANHKCRQKIEEQQHRNHFFSRGRRPKWNIRE